MTAVLQPCETVSLDTLGRMTSNPFFPFMDERIDEGISARRANVLRPP
jgi:hypothetical protein